MSPAAPAQTRKTSEQNGEPRPRIRAGAPEPKDQINYLSRYKGAFNAFQPQVVLQAANAIERLLQLPFASWPTGASGGQMSFNLGS